MSHGKQYKKLTWLHKRIFTKPEFTKGFIQGLITATLEAMKEFYHKDIKSNKKATKNKEIHITTSDKGGGINIMNRSTYNDKVNLLLSDTNKYEKMNEHKIIRDKK